MRERGKSWKTPPIIMAGTAALAVGVRWDTTAAAGGIAPRTQRRARWRRAPPTKRPSSLCCLSSPPSFAMDDDKFDGMYMNLAGSVGGIDPLLDSFFGFLR